MSFLLASCTRELFISCFQEEKCSGYGVGTGGQSVLPVPAAFQMSLAQNNPYGKVAYLGLAYSANFQLWKRAGQDLLMRVIHRTETNRGSLLRS